MGHGPPLSPRAQCGFAPRTPACDPITLDEVTAVELGLPAVRGNPDTAGRPGTPLLVDRFGRIATDLRVSLTDRCNLRCTYCMPAEGLDWLPKPDLLTDAELTRLLDVAVTRLGGDRRPVHRRRAAAAARPGRGRGGDRRAAAPAADLDDHERVDPGAGAPKGSRRPAWTGSTSRWTPSTRPGSAR
ncbi:hypothetical protein GCM10018963_20570 [Saccharothrix longispora]